MRASTLGGLLRERAAQSPRDLAFGFLADGERALQTRTNAELDQEAIRVGAGIADRVAPGGRVVLGYAPGLEFLAALFGCCYAGAVAVVVVPPMPPRLEAGTAHLRKVVRDCRAELLCTTGDLEPLFAGLTDVRVLATDRVRDPSGPLDMTSGPDDVALVQYTSGSTGDPRGVVLRHRNLLANQAAIAEKMQSDRDQTTVSWLPIYHDMGLIGCLFQPLWVGYPCYFMSPLHFLERPARWLEAISRFGGTISGGPDFGYSLCVDRVAKEDGLTLDLSTWRVAFSGAEPVRPGTLRRFEQRFGPDGFRPETFFPCYGLAEASLLVTGADHRTPPVVRRLDTGSLAAGRARDVAEGGTPMVSCGRAPADHDVVIVDPVDGRPLPDDTVGEIWTCGPSVADGYWQRPEANPVTFGQRIEGRDGAYLRTGDLGFLRDGELFVSGRMKEMMIIRGRNVFPQDIEAAGQSAERRARRGCGAAFSVGETLVLVQETAVTDDTALSDVAAALRRAVLEDQSVALGRVVLVPPRTLPKTSSGKMRRRECRRLLAESELPALHVWVAPPVHEPMESA